MFSQHQLAKDGHRALIVWLAVAAALLALRVAATGFRPALARDSFQYLSVAAHTVRGETGETSLIHYDAERSFGTVPAPMVTFPIGYPAAITPLALAGVSLPRAALLVNAAAALACVALLWWTTGHLALDRLPRHVVLAFAVVNGSLLQLAGMAMSEVLFTTIVLAGVALLARARWASGSGIRYWVAAGFALGIAYQVRYAGLFVVIGLVTVTARRLLVPRRSLFVGHVVASLVAVLLVAVGMTRNIMLVGNWRGRHASVVSHEVDGVIYESLRAADLLLLGPGAASGESSVPRVLFVLLVVLGAGLLIARRRRDGSPPGFRESANLDFAIDLTLMLGAYATCMFYAALTTNISYGARMFVPTLPIIALLLGVTLSAFRLPLLTGFTPRLARATLAAAFVLYVALNLQSLERPLVDRAASTRREMNGTIEAGLTVREVVKRYAGSDGVIVANNGQAVGFVLNRRTISLVGPRYSSAVWDETGVRQLVRRYAARVIVITAPSRARPEDDDLIPTPFVRALAHGDAPPWLRLVGRAGAIRVYVPMLHASLPGSVHRHVETSHRRHVAGPNSS